MSDSVVIDTRFESPIAKVWSALTTPEILSEWMMFKSNTFKPEVGHTFEFSGAQGYDQTINCVVTELDEPHKLAYTWTAPGVDGSLSETLVTFSLSESGGGTDLNLVITGFKEGARQEKGGAKAAWGYMLSELEKVLA